MTKIIRVTSCARCDKKADRKTTYNIHCKPTYNSHCKQTGKKINKYIEAKTIHPDCPLGDEVDSKLLERKYYELLHYVQTKYPEELRYDTD